MDYVLSSVYIEFPKNDKLFYHRDVTRYVEGNILRAMRRPSARRSRDTVNAISIEA